MTLFWPYFSNVNLLYIQYIVGLAEVTCFVVFVVVRLHDSIQDEGFHYLVFDL